MLAVLIVSLVSGLAVPASASRAVCHVVTDPAGDAVRPIRGTGMSTPNDPTLDVLSADVGIGVQTLAFVVRVAHLGDALSQGAQTDSWQMYFTVRGKSFATNATRAPDGVSFTILGDLPEQYAAPGFTPEANVSGSFNIATNEIRVDVPRRYLPVMRPSKEVLLNLTVDSITGVGLLTAEGARLGTTVDRTEQPGPRMPLNTQSCVVAR